MVDDSKNDDDTPKQPVDETAKSSDDAKEPTSQQNEVESAPVSPEDLDKMAAEAETDLSKQFDALNIPDVEKALDEVALAPVDPWAYLDAEAAKRYEAHFLQHLRENVFGAVSIFDRSVYEAGYEGYPGELLDHYRLSNGIWIYIYEKAIMLGVGESAYREYGNRWPMTEALIEILDTVVREKNWDLAIDATAPHYEDVAWAVAINLGLNVEAGFPLDSEASVIADRLVHVADTLHVNRAKLKKVEPTPKGGS